MNVHHAIESFCTYSPQEQIDFLLRFAHKLTILARDTYAAGEDGLTHPSRMRRINEVQHRVVSFLIALRQNDPQRYPEDTLVRIMLEHPEDPDLQRQLQNAFGHLMGQMATTT
jgi:hypothetical protein